MPDRAFVKIHGVEESQWNSGGTVGGYTNRILGSTLNIPCSLSGTRILPTFLNSNLFRSSYQNYTVLGLKIDLTFTNYATAETYVRVWPCDNAIIGAGTLHESAIANGVQTRQLNVATGTGRKCNIKMYCSAKKFAGNNPAMIENSKFTLTDYPNPLTDPPDNWFFAVYLAPVKAGDTVNCYYSAKMTWYLCLTEKINEITL